MNRNGYRPNKMFPITLHSEHCVWANVTMVIQFKWIFHHWDSIPSKLYFELHCLKEVQIRRIHITSLSISRHVPISIFLSRFLSLLQNKWILYSLEHSFTILWFSRVCRNSFSKIDKMKLNATTTRFSNSSALNIKWNESLEWQQ